MDKDEIDSRIGRTVEQIQSQVSLDVVGAIVHYSCRPAQAGAFGCKRATWLNRTNYRRVLVEFGVLATPECSE
jgi:hypothetical protein